MATKGLMTALTLYRCGTLTFTQAATRAGQNAESFARALEQYGIPTHPEASATELRVGPQH